MKNVVRGLASTLVNLQNVDAGHRRHYLLDDLGNFDLKLQAQYDCSAFCVVMI